MTRLEASGAVMVEEEPSAEATTSIRQKREDVEASGMERSADEDEDEDMMEETTVETTTVTKVSVSFEIRLHWVRMGGGASCAQAFLNHIKIFVFCN
ncbi:hypothetical protein ANCCAN_30174 [Ancylostoma caninum]|uniref:Uncharacterized protein n=1 Tax=Ancylostoma caninum TaxID=29170 RepID=A0A368EWV6_ANCCA|nr:hypothetical protein ANCCAN_30174 [Ancylostoma caninum]